VTDEQLMQAIRDNLPFTINPRLYVMRLSWVTKQYAVQHLHRATSPEKAIQAIDDIHGPSFWEIPTESVSKLPDRLNYLASEVRVYFKELCYLIYCNGKVLLRVPPLPENMPVYTHYVANPHYRPPW
jgi:hypothetical protein